eukprot:scaffold28114_cov53-Attheya_sp.AAC.4
MRRDVIFLLVVFLSSSSGTTCASFISLGAPRFCRQRPTRQHTHNVLAAYRNDDETSDNTRVITATQAEEKHGRDEEINGYVDEEVPTIKGASSSLKFSARTVFSSEPLPLPEEHQASLVDFFANSLHRNHLLLGHGSPPIAQKRTADDKEKSSKDENVPAVKSLPSPPPPELWDRWRVEARRAGTVPPNPDIDELIVVNSSGIPFPLGVTIFVESIVGFKLLLPTIPRESGSTPYSSPSSAEYDDDNDTQNYPEYQFTLVKDTVRAEGPRALVWVHDKLTGAGKDKPEQITHSFSSLKVMKQQSESSSQVMFTSESRIEINVQFPSMLLRLLPMSREKCNYQGSEAIQKTFEDRGKPSLDNFVQAYVKWLDE